MALSMVRDAGCPVTRTHWAGVGAGLRLAAQRCCQEFCPLPPGHRDNSREGAPAWSKRQADRTRSEAEVAVLTRSLTMKRLLLSILGMRLASKRAQTLRVRPRLEALEDRNLCSGTLPSTDIGLVCPGEQGQSLLASILLPALSRAR